MERPLHAYVPGRTERPAEGAYDAVRDTAQPGMTEDQLGRSQAFQAGLAFLERGYFWEAHEVLEPVWLAAAPNSAARTFVQGLIQLANAELKVKMERPQAVRRLATIAAGHLAEAARTSDVHLGIEVAGFEARAYELLKYAL